MIKDKIKYDDEYIKSTKSFKLVDIKEKYQEIVIKQ